MAPKGQESRGPWTVDAAYRYCEWMAKTHYENFTVASRFLPKAQRRPIYAIYSFCRMVDDLGDEGPEYWQTVPDNGFLPSIEMLDDDPFHFARTSGVGTGLQEKDHRLQLLDWWEGELRDCYEGEPAHPIMVALQDTIRRHDIPIEPFLKLIKANRLDQQQDRYQTYDDLLYYCDHSANPVGHLFLYLFGYRDGQRQALSDATCTALQLTNFWQDVARDYAKGRIYVPLEDLERLGCSEADLAAPVSIEPVRRLLAFEVERAMELFRQGAPLVETLSGPAKLDVALFTRGGVAVLDAIKARNYDVLTDRPALSKSNKVRLLLSTWLGWKLGRGLLPRFADEASFTGGKRR